MTMTDQRPMVDVYEPDENGVEHLVYRAMNDDEYAQWQVEQVAAQSAALAGARATKAAEIQAALSATDPWIARAWEDGLAELPTARAAYREQLRELLLETQTSDDPAAIEIPAAPAWVPPKS